MKRVISVLLCLSIVGGVASCSKETTITKSTGEVTTTTTTESAQDTNETMSLEDAAALGDIEVDDGLLTVTITIPADLAGEDSSQETVDKVVEEKGYLSGTYNSDGSITYTMTKAKHKQIVEDFVVNVDETLQGFVDSEDYPNILAITHNDDFTDFVITYADEQVALGDSFTVIVYYYAGGMYGVLSGDRPENIHVAFVDADTGEIISEANSKDAGSSESEE